MGKYQWPASQLTEKEMSILFCMREKTGHCISDLLKRAVHTAYGEEVKDEASIRGNNKDDTKAL